MFKICVSLLFLILGTANSSEDHYKNLIDYQNSIATGEFRKACSNVAVLKSPASRVNTTTRLTSLRQVMNTPSKLRSSETLHALLVTSNDEHLTDFVSNFDKRAEYISGFSGSKGEAIITMDKAALWVEGRYHFQANDQLDCNWLLMRKGHPLVPSIAKWLNIQFPNGARIGADPKLLSADEWNNLEAELKNQSTSLHLLKTDFDLIHLTWINHNETEQEKEAFTIDDKYAGKPWTDKVNELRKKLKELNTQAMVVTALDEIAWLLNVRGRDIPYTRFVKSYVLISQIEILFYVHQNKVKDNVTTLFNAKYPGITKHTVIIRNYHSFWTDLSTYLQSWTSILLPSSCVYSQGVSKKVYDLVDPRKRVSLPSPIIYMKAIKNPTEIKGMRNAHIRDGAAMCKFLEHFESRFNLDDRWDELKTAKEIDRFRLEQDLALNISFRTIVAFGDHGALPDYEPSVTTSRQISDNSTVIIHSGGQYLDGTTAIARTLHFGNPTDLERESYTRALMGSIKLSTLIFPDFIETSSVDIMARSPIWEIGQDYPYSTGHGIGAFLGVRESPIDINYNSKLSNEKFKPGYFFTNGPGIFREDSFGVKVENVLEVIKKPHLKHHYGHSYLGFQDVTLVPYCNKLIKIDLLSVHQRRWLNEYNARIRRYVGAELKRQNSTDAFYWMMDNTRNIPEYGHASLPTSKPLLILIINVVLSKAFSCVLY